MANKTKAELPLEDRGIVLFREHDRELRALLNATANLKESERLWIGYLSAAIRACFVDIGSVEATRVVMGIMAALVARWPDESQSLRKQKRRKQ